MNTNAINQVIADLRCEGCGKCKIGQAIKGLEEILGTQQAPAATNPVPKVAAIEKPAPVKKPLIRGRKTGHTPKSGSVNRKEKTCHACKLPLPIDEFPKNKTCADGHTGTCKKCTYKRVKAAKPAPSVPVDMAQVAICKLCNSFCSTPESYRAHMDKVHGKKVA